MFDIPGMRGLRKIYRNRKGRHVALAGLDLNVPIGCVHGFLGPNRVLVFRRRGVS